MHVQDVKTGVSLYSVPYVLDYVYLIVQLYPIALNVIKHRVIKQTFTNAREIFQYLNISEFFCAM